MKAKLNIQILLFTLLAGSLLLASCSGSKRAAIQKEISVAKELSVTESGMIDNAQVNKSLKLTEENIDSAINSNISILLNKYRSSLDSFDLAVHFIDSVIKSHKLFVKNKQGLNSQITYIRNYSSNSTKRLRRFQMIDDGLSIAKQYLFNLAAFFGPGKYKIPDEKIAEATERFSPILDSVSSFYKKYNDVSKFVTIRILGYADGTGFNKESETAKTLQFLLSDSLASKERLNGKLSELRAKNIANLLDNILSTKIDNYRNIQHLEFLFFETGKGEELPSKKITDYQVNDERRRVVLLFWSILPK
jgi:hypothetical protein